MSNCPKCNEKLSPFYLKQNCPKCGTNLVYYDLDKRLEQDHEKAMKEQEAVDKFLYKLKMSTVGTKISLVRFVLFFSPLVWMLLPMFKAKDGVTISLLSVIMGIINGSMPLDKIFGDMSYLLPIVTMVCVIIFSLMVIISSCFSMGKKAYLRNTIFSIINLVCFVVITALAISNCALIGAGAFVVFGVYVIEFVLHKAVDKKVNK